MNGIIHNRKTFLKFVFRNCIKIIARIAGVKIYSLSYLQNEAFITVDGFFEYLADGSCALISVRHISAHAVKRIV